MAYLAAELITKAWYLSGIVSQDFETVGGARLAEGFDLLNALLAIKTANNRLIPYFTPYTTNAVVGQEAYFVPNLINAETITFNLQTIRFATLRQSRKQFFGSPRVDNITALPFNAHVERAKGGANIYFYFLPSDTYPIKVWGKFGLSSIASLDTDLELTLDPFYIEYLRYALAEYMCADNNITLQPQNQAKLTEYENVITDISPIDLTVTKLSSLGSDRGINWGFVNLSGGWVP